MNKAYLDRLNNVSASWQGIVNEATVHGIAHRIREMFEGKVFTIVQCHYIDRDYRDGGWPSIEVTTDATIKPGDWTDRSSKEAVRVFPAKDGSRAWFAFSAGHWFWSFHAVPQEVSDDDDYRNAVFQFDNDQMVITTRAPAGKGYLHRHTFCVQRGRE